MVGKKILIVTHGLGEHSKRYQFVHDLFGSEYSVITYDLRGHGSDQRCHGTIDRFESYREDLKQIVDRVLFENPTAAITLMGHSMGALITADFCQRYHDDLVANSIKKVILSAPPMGVMDPLGKLIHALPFAISSLLARLPLHIPFKGAVNANYLSHDSQVVKAYLNDPLNILAPSLKLLLNLIANSKRVFGGDCSYLKKFHPHLFVGQLDMIVAVSKIRKISKLITVTEVADGFHELHNEIEPIRSNYLKALALVLKE